MKYMKIDKGHFCTPPHARDLLAREERGRLEQRRDELKAELRWVETKLSADTSAKLALKCRTLRGVYR
jgi:hypothetical protein